MKATFTSATAVEKRDFRCTGCGHEAEATVIGIGEGTQSSLNSKGTAQRRAEDDALADIDRTLALATCPSCGARAPGAARRWWIRRSLPVVLTAIGVAFLGWLPMIAGMNMKEDDKLLAGIIMTAIAVGVGGLMFVISVVLRWSAAKAGVTFGAEPTTTSDTG